MTAWDTQNMAENQNTLKKPDIKTLQSMVMPHSMAAARNIVDIVAVFIMTAQNMAMALHIATQDMAIMAMMKVMVMMKVMPMMAAQAMMSSWNIKG